MCECVRVCLIYLCVCVCMCVYVCVCVCVCCGGLGFLTDYTKFVRNL